MKVSEIEAGQTIEILDRKKGRNNTWEISEENNKLVANLKGWGALGVCYLDEILDADNQTYKLLEK